MLGNKGREGSELPTPGHWVSRPSIWLSCHCRRFKSSNWSEEYKKDTFSEQVLSSVVLSFPEDNDRGNLSLVLHALTTNSTQRAVGTPRSTDGGPNWEGVKLLIKGFLCYLFCPSVVGAHGTMKSKTAESEKQAKSWLCPLLATWNGVTAPKENSVSWSEKLAH